MKSFLGETNMKKPAVLKLFDNLVEVGILDKNLKTPVNTDELESYIKKLKLKR